MKPSKTNEKLAGEIASFLWESSALRHGLFTPNEFIEIAKGRVHEFLDKREAQRHSADLSDEEVALDSIFGDAKKWNGRSIFWCNLCETFSLNPECECRGTSCNAGGCEKCGPVLKEFETVKSSVEAYLTEEEVKTMQKISRLKKLIPLSISMGDKKIDWQKMETAGQLCKADHDKYFPEETKGLTPYGS